MHSVQENKGKNARAEENKKMMTTKNTHQTL